MESKEQIKTELEDGANKPAVGRTITQDEKDFIALAVKRMKEYDEAHREAIEEAKKDIRFIVNGEQWDEGSEYVKRRRTNSLPCLVFNHGLPTVDNTLGEIRQNLPRVKYRAVDSKTDPKQAEIRTSLLRHIEEVSKSDRQWYEAEKQAVTSGYPAFIKILNDYPDPDTFNQEIFIRHIPFQFSVRLDPRALAYDRPDRGGPKWGSFGEYISRAEFKTRFPEAQMVDLKDVGERETSWWNENDVRIESYFVAVPKKIKVVMLKGGMVLTRDSKEWKALEERAATTGQQIEIEVDGEGKPRERESTKYVIEHYVISSREILDGPTVIPGSYIPIVPVEGKYNWVDGKKKWRGVYSTAKDANKLENIFASKATESVLVGPKYKATPKMIGAHESIWNNPENQRLLYYEPDPMAPNMSPVIDQNSVADVNQSIGFMQQASQMRKDLSAKWEASFGAPSNEKSGRAILARDSNSNQTHYEFPANLADSMGYAATIIDSMIPEVYDYEMVVRIIGEDGREKSMVEVNKPIPAAEGGDVVNTILNDLSAARFDTVVDVGPTLKTQRMEAADNMLKLSQTNPVVAQVGGDLIARSLDFPYADDLAKRLELTLPPPIQEQIRQGDDKQAAMQGMIKQAVDQVQQQAMQAFQAAEQKLQELTAKNQQLQQAVDDKAAELALRKQELDLKDKEIERDFQAKLIAEQAKVTTARNQQEQEPKEPADKPPMQVIIDTTGKAVEMSSQRDDMRDKMHGEHMAAMMDQMNSNIVQIANAVVAGIAHAMNQPKEVVRDKQGRAVGVRTVDNGGMQ